MEKPTIIDSHCHLDYLERDGQDIQDVVDRASAEGVSLMVTIGTKLREFDKVLSIAERFPSIYCTVGIHPHEAEEEGPDVTVEQLVELAKHPKVIGIGETGLDYYYEHSPRDIQIDSFRAHIEAARETQLPLIVHTRNADDDTNRILSEEYEKGAFPGLIHCFSSSHSVAETAISIGFKVSLSGIITFKTAQSIRDSVASIPLSELLVETDSPYLAPIPHRGKKNEPAFVRHTAERLAEIHSVSYEELAATTTQNFYNLFTKIPNQTLAAQWYTWVREAGECNENNHSWLWNIQRRSCGRFGMGRLRSE